MRISFGAACVLGLASSCLAQPVVYSATPIGSGEPLMPFAMSPGGVIAGVRHTGPSAWDGTLRAYTGPAGLSAWGYGVSDSGIVVGETNAGGFPRAFTADPVHGLSLIPPLAEIDAIAYGVNMAGEVVGSTSAAAFRWHGGALSYLPAPSGLVASAYSINNAGGVAGATWDGSRQHPAAWVGGSFAQLPLAAGFVGGRARGISDSGLLVGTLESDTGSGAALWRDGICEVLPGLGGAYASAVAANSAGQIVGLDENGAGGSVAVTWIGGQVYPLHSLLTGVTSASLTHVGGIDEYGRIVAHGEINGALGAYVLTPVPAPSGAALLALAVPACRRRR